MKGTLPTELGLLTTLEELYFRTLPSVYMSVCLCVCVSVCVCVCVCQSPSGGGGGGGGGGGTCVCGKPSVFVWVYPFGCFASDCNPHIYIYM